MIYASAIETASAATTHYYNTANHEFEASNGFGQSSQLGIEWDFGTSLVWDDALQFDLDFGFWFPGNFFSYSASAASLLTQTVFAGVARIGIKFGEP